MKFSIFRFIFWCLSFICLYSCDSSIPIVNVPYDGDRLVLNGAIFPQGVAVQLSHSSGPFTLLPDGHESLFLKDGFIELVDSVTSDRFILDNKGDGSYTLDKMLQVKHPYKLVAQSPNYTTVESDWIYIPDFTPIDSLRLSLKDESKVYSTLDLRFKFQDEKSTEVEYYILDMWLLVKDKRFRVDEYFDLDGLTIQSCALSTFVSVHFPDVCFDGAEFPLDMTLKRPNMTTQDSLYLEFGKITELYYTYFDYLDQPDDALSLAFTDPFIIPSNVQNGYGMVVGENLVKLTLPLQ